MSDSYHSSGSSSGSDVFEFQPRKFREEKKRQPSYVEKFKTQSINEYQNSDTSSQTSDEDYAKGKRKTKIKKLKRSNVEDKLSRLDKFQENNKMCKESDSWSSSEEEDVAQNRRAATVSDRSKNLLSLSSSSDEESESGSQRGHETLRNISQSRRQTTVNGSITSPTASATTAALRKSKEAKIELMKAQQSKHIVVVAEENVDDRDDTDAAKVTEIIEISSPKELVKSYERINIETRIKGGNPTLTHIYQLKMTDPFLKLINAHRSKYEYSSVYPLALEYKGNNLDIDSTPRQNAMFGKILIDICDSSERQRQLEQMPTSARINGTTSSSLHHPKQLFLKFRINGCKELIQSNGIRSNDQFSVLVDDFCKKKNVIHSECKFTFDGCILNINSTVEDEDLEGGEIIDVVVDEGVLKQGKLNESTDKISSTFPSKITRNQTDMQKKVLKTTESSCRNIPKPVQPMVFSVDDNSVESLSTMVTVQTIRNNNTQFKPKKFRLYLRDSIFRLKEGYLRYYKKKGCRSVCFYFKNIPILNETQNLRSLGVCDMAVLHAIENGKTYAPV